MAWLGKFSMIRSDSLKETVLLCSSPSKYDETNEALISKHSGSTTRIVMNFVKSLACHNVEITCPASIIIFVSSDIGLITFADQSLGI